MVDMDIDASPSAPSAPAAPKEETRPNGSHPTSSLAAIKTKGAPVGAEAPTSTAKREVAGHDVPGRPEVKVEFLIRVSDAHMLAGGKYALQQQQQQEKKAKKKKKANGKNGEVEEDFAAVKPRDEGSDGPIVVVRLDCDPHGLPSEKEANDKTLNSLSWCWKNHFIPKREFDPLFAPSLGKKAGIAGTPGGSPSRPPSSRKEARDQSPREKSGRDKQDAGQVSGYGDLGLDVASLSKLPLDGVVKGRDHARRLCDAMWHASGLEPRMLGTKRFAFVGEQRAVRKAREEAKEREQQRLKALAAQKKRQQRTQAAQKEKASVGAAKAKEAGPGTDPKTPKGRAAREGGKKDKERRGSQPSDKSHGANAKSRVQEAEREAPPDKDKDKVKVKATPLSSKTKPEAKMPKAKSKSSPTQAMDVDVKRSPPKGGANGQAKAEDQSEGAGSKSKSSRAKERDVRDKEKGGRKGKDKEKESRESDQGGRKDLRSAKKDKAGDDDKSPLGGVARKETRERSSARMERRRSGDPPHGASTNHVQASSEPQAPAAATPSRPTRAAAPRAGSLKDTYTSPSKQAKQSGPGQGQGKASQVSPKTPKHKDRATAKETDREANKETPTGEERPERARPGLRERPESTTPSPLRERRPGRDPSAHDHPQASASSSPKTLPLSPIMTAAASDPSLHTPLNQVQGPGPSGEMNDEQLAMLLHQELNAPSSRRRRRDPSSDLLFSPNSPSRKTRKTD